MAQDQLFTFIMALTSLAGLAMLTVASLRGWRLWLDLKRAELDRIAPSTTHSPADPGRLPAAERIEMADLKERIRKLEAIAAGVDI